MPEPVRVPSSARHYAAAIFELAQAEGGFKPWSGRLSRVRELFEDEVMQAALANPSLTAAHKVSVVEALVSEPLSPAEMNLVKLLLSTRRHRLMAAIIAAYDALVDRACGRQRVMVTTAVELDQGQLHRLGEELGQRLESQVVLESRVDPQIIAGLIVRIGDRVYDASMSGRLAQLRQALLA